MEKSIKDYLHLYKDCMVQVKRKNDKEFHIGRVCEISSNSNHGDWVIVRFDDVITVTSNTWEESTSNAHYFFFGEDQIIPFFRPLSDMTENEAIELHRITTPHLVIDWPADKDKYDVSYLKDHMLTKEHPNYGYINAIQVVDLRAPHDYMNINDRWDILRYNHEENEEPKINERVNHQPKAFAYLLSKHFDLFCLIEAGLAIDKTTLNK